MTFFVRLRQRDQAPEPKRDTVAIFPDEDGTLQQMDEEGNVSDLAGAGSLPSPSDEGDVLTVVSGDWAGAAPSGGSQPGAVRLLDLGVVQSADVEDGPITLYTPEAGEIVGPVYIRVTSFPNNYAIEIQRDEQVISGVSNLFMPPLAGVDGDTSWDGFVASSLSAFGGVGQFSGRNRAAATTIGPVKAALAYSLPPNQQTIAPWLPNHEYDGDVGVPAVIESGHIWTASSTFTSGGSQPDFAGNIGGSVMDNGGEWTDENPAPTGAEFHVYAFSAIPVVPD